MAKNHGKHPEKPENKAPMELTRYELRELEQRKKTRSEMILDVIYILLPFVFAGLAMAEYRWVPNKFPNPHPERYSVFLIILIAIYSVYLLIALIKRRKGDALALSQVRYRAPLISGVFVFLTLYDYLTLKTGILTQPFIPCVNHIINAGVTDFWLLVDCTLATLKLLFLGYFIGVFLGLITGIACGYSPAVRYWINPIINVLGPIPTVTWIPIMMVIASSLFMGAVFIIALGAWFAVTVATMTGIANVDKEYFEAAKTLGATQHQLVSRIAIPGAIPSILQGCVQAMSSACVSIMIAEMLGVKSGLGWYMNWQKSWAAYDKMFAALIVICIVFIIVAKGLEKIKQYLLRWQTGDEN